MATVQKQNKWKKINKAIPTPRIKLIIKIKHQKGVKSGSTLALDIIRLVCKIISGGMWDVKRRS